MVYSNRGDSISHSAEHQQENLGVFFGPLNPQSQPSSFATPRNEGLRSNTIILNAALNVPRLGETYNLAKEFDACLLLISGLREIPAMEQGRLVAGKCLQQRSAW